MIFLLLLVLNVFLLFVQAKSIRLSEQSQNHRSLRLAEMMLGLHLLICAGALLLKITYHHNTAMIAAVLPVALGGVLSVLMPLLPGLKFRYLLISFSNNNRKIIFD